MRADLTTHILYQYNSSHCIFHFLSPCQFWNVPLNYDPISHPDAGLLTMLHAPDGWFSTHPPSVFEVCLIVHLDNVSLSVCSSALHPFSRVVPLSFLWRSHELVIHKKVRCNWGGMSSVLCFVSSSETQAFHGHPKPRFSGALFPFLD